MQFLKATLAVLATDLHSLVNSLVVRGRYGDTNIMQVLEEYPFSSPAAMVESETGYRTPNRNNALPTTARTQPSSCLDSPLPALSKYIIFYLPPVSLINPSVTAVGGTFQVPEVAVGFSGGGFSDYWPQPEYQKKAVQAYLDSLPEGQYDGLFNR